MTYLKRDNPQVRENVLKKYNSMCAYCGCKLTKQTLCIDHIQPELKSFPGAERGPSTYDNYNPCCIPCNTSKSYFTIDEWRYMISLKVDNLLKGSSEFRTCMRLGIVKRVKKEFKFYFETLNNK